MKSASEIRALMMNDYGSRIPVVMSRLEDEIVKAAELGYGHVVVFVPVKTCSFNCAKNISNQILDLGYECKIEYVADQRDGDSIKFFIEWLVI